MAPLHGRDRGARGTHSRGLCCAVGGGGAGRPHAAWQELRRKSGKTWGRTDVVAYFMLSPPIFSYI